MVVKSGKQGFCSKYSLCSKWSLLIILSLVAFSLIAFFKWIAFEWILDHQISQKLQLLPGSETFEQWKNIPFPILMKFRIFNVTNPVEVQNGAKPQLVEAGPYVYAEKRVKEIIAMDSEKDTITYTQKIFYTFRPDLSNGSEYDRLFVINIPFVALSKASSDVLGNLSFAHGIADLNMRQRGEKLFKFATVKEYIFDGFDVKHYLKFLSNPLLSLFGGGIKIPKSLLAGRFGFYYGRNGTDDGEYVIRTGKTNPLEFGQIVSWNGKSKLDDYYQGMCNLINGTDGSITHPFLTTNSLFRFFSPDICRSLFAIYRHDVEYKGLKLYRFKLPTPKQVFDHKDFCFCPMGKNNECFKQGAFSMAPCSDGAPISMSFAHLLGSYEPYIQNVEGLHPNPEIHETFLDIEPKTGAIIRAAKRLQFNVMVTQNKFMSTFSKVKSTMIPFVWVEEMVEATDEFIESLNEQLFQPIAVVNMVTIGGLISCAILVVLGLVGCTYTCISPHRKKINSVSGNTIPQETNLDISKSPTGFMDSVVNSSSQVKSVESKNIQQGE